MAILNDMSEAPLGAHQLGLAPAANDQNEIKDTFKTFSKFVRLGIANLKKFEKFKSGLGDFGNPAAETENPTAGIGEDASTTTIEVTDTSAGGDTTVPTEGTDAEAGGGGNGSGRAGRGDRGGQ
jgi:hypothetical protein